MGRMLEILHAVTVKICHAFFLFLIPILKKYFEFSKINGNGLMAFSAKRRFCKTQVKKLILILTVKMDNVT